jgi:DNA-binding transcriptional ArsR family regulator
MTARQHTDRSFYFPGILPLILPELSACVGCQVPNMSQHLAVLRGAGLVSTRRDGSTVYYRLADPRVLEAYRLICGLAG